MCTADVATRDHDRSNALPLLDPSANQTPGFVYGTVVMSFRERIQHDTQRRPVLIATKALGFKARNPQQREPRALLGCNPPRGPKAHQRAAFIAELKFTRST